MSFLPMPTVDEDGRPILFPLARGEGVLGGDPSTGCLWFAGRNGETAPLTLYHDTAHADFSTSPFTIRDGDRILATQGQLIAVGGGGTPAGMAADGCPQGPGFRGRLVEGQVVSRSRAGVRDTAAE